MLVLQLHMLHNNVRRKKCCNNNAALFQHKIHTTYKISLFLHLSHCFATIATCVTLLFNSHFQLEKIKYFSTFSTMDWEGKKIGCLAFTELKLDKNWGIYM